MLTITHIPLFEGFLRVLTSDRGERKKVQFNLVILEKRFLSTSSEMLFYLGQSVFAAPRKNDTA